MVRWQTWQRMTGIRLTVTGKRREPELLITPDHARPAGAPAQRLTCPAKLVPGPEQQAVEAAPGSVHQVRTFVWLSHIAGPPGQWGVTQEQEGDHHGRP